jgi:hypothetical protein
VRNLAVEAELMLGQAIKPTSGIESWVGWPADVRELLREWNRGTRDRPMKLSFYRRGIFDCADCGVRCEPARSGVAYLNGSWLCDDCLIDRARRIEATQ